MVSIHYIFACYWIDVKADSNPYIDGWWSSLVPFALVHIPAYDYTNLLDPVSRGFYYLYQFYNDLEDLIRLHAGELQL